MWVGVVPVVRYYGKMAIEASTERASEPSLPFNMLEKRVLYNMLLCGNDFPSYGVQTHDNKRTPHSHMGRREKVSGFFSSVRVRFSSGVN